MKNIAFAALAFLLIICLEVHAQTLHKLWEVSGFEAPESVIYDSKNKAYYVANVVGNPDVKDGNGYISKIDEQGKLVNQKWVSRLDAPKGMGIHNGKLYVADINRVAIVDIAKGTVDKFIPAEGATFLNDVTTAPNGDVYISDTFQGNSIYRLTGDKMELWLKDDQLDHPNGLLVKGGDLFVCSWGSTDDPQNADAVKGKVLKVSLKDKKITDLTESFINGDGLAEYKNGFVVSDWPAGKIFFVDNKGSVQELGSFNAGTADIALVTSKNILLIPQMMEGKVLAFSIK